MGPPDSSLRPADAPASDPHPSPAEAREALLCIAVGSMLAGLLAVSVWISGRQAETFLKTFPAAADAFVWTARGDLLPAALFAAVPIVALFGAATLRPVAWLAARHRAPLRRGLLGLAALTTGLSVGWLRLHDGREGVVADGDGVVWFANGRQVAHADWSGAEAVLAACTADRRRATLRYRVSFPGGRVVRFDGAGDLGPAWPRRIAPIDAALRAADVPREGRVEEGCLRDTARALPADLDGLRSVFHTARQAK